MSAVQRGRRLWLATGGTIVVVLLAFAFTLGSLNTPFTPNQGIQYVILFALSIFVFSSLLIFGLILLRNVVRLWAESRAGQLGSQFKTKMVLGAMGISLLPIVFLFFVSYALLNRTLGKWFPRPLEIASAQSQQLLNELGKQEHARLTQIAEDAARRGLPSALPFLRATSGIDAAWTSQAGVNFAMVPLDLGRDARSVEAAAAIHPVARTLPSGVVMWEIGGVAYLTGRSAMGQGILVVGRRMPSGFAGRLETIAAQRQTYVEEQQQLRAFRLQMLVTLGLATVLLLFSVTWTALYLSKQVTVPIGALAEATREISRGNFDHRVTVRAQDELGTLVASFNQMTAQLGESGQKIQEFNRSLQQAVNEIEQRRRVMETILENIPTGVLSLEENGAVTRVNPAVVRIFGDAGRGARSIAELVGPEAAPIVERLMRRSLRMGTASKELEITLPSRVLHAAVTVSSLGPRRASPGYVIVIDDLSELLHAQKSAAWQEVAQRIAHEIKNPLTPIQLSAQRLKRFFARQSPPGTAGAPRELEQLVAECAGLIEREVATLEGLVDEFSQFARFPEAKPVAVDLNAIVSSAVEIFSGRLDAINVRLELATTLPSVKADPELLRRVLVNLIDNAAEAMEASPRKVLEISSRLATNGETAEVTVADTGHGIAPSDKDKLFLPHFSTRGRGTGLGLAIADRIIAEHHGTIRVEDNSPQGSRFVIRLPLAEGACAAVSNAAAARAQGG
jgi:PAS domain S-box-containing protein